VGQEKNWVELCEQEQTGVIVHHAGQRNGISFALSIHFLGLRV
jgi:hypothetical protein